MRYPRRYNAGLPWRLPDPPLRTSALRGIAAAGSAAFVIALVSGPLIGAGSGYLVKTLGVFATVSALAFGAVGAHHPFSRMGPANQITLFRAALVAAAVGQIGEPPSATAAWLAVGITSVAAILDGVDGWLARRSGQSSAFGARFDMETDALLILGLSVLVWQHGKAGLWVLACGVMRYAFVACTRLVPWMGGPLRSTLRGKTVAIGQLVGLGVALSPAVPSPYSNVTSAVTLAVLAWSFAVDVLWLYRRD
jgi:phosphatidylglycerophosphate synthase